MKWQKKTKPAPWTLAYPSQVRQPKKSGPSARSAASPRRSSTLRRSRSTQSKSWQERLQESAARKAARKLKVKTYGLTSPAEVEERRERVRYARARNRFFREHPFCQCCIHPPRPVKDIHHVRGRHKSLLCDERFWMAVCRPCHNWIHQHVALSRKLGWLAEPGDWNKEVE